MPFVSICFWLGLGFRAGWICLGNTGASTKRGFSDMRIDQDFEVFRLVVIVVTCCFKNKLIYDYLQSGT